MKTFCPWQPYQNSGSAERLMECISERPLQKEDVSFFVEKLMGGVEVTPHCQNAYLTCRPQEKKPYRITISDTLTPQEQGIALAHEIAHVFYGACFQFGLHRDRDENIEKSLEDEAQRFYLGNKSFMDSVTMCLFRGNAATLLFYAPSEARAQRG